MAEALSEQREEVGPRPTLDLTASASGTPEGGFSFSVSLKITNKWLAAGALAGIGLAALLYKHPELVTGAVRSALEGPGLQVGDISPGSLLVELNCNMKESLLSFVKDFKTKKVKQRLEQEFQKVGFEVELEVTIANDEEVYEKLAQIRSKEKQESKKDDEVAPIAGVRSRASGTERKTSGSVVAYNESRVLILPVGISFSVVVGLVTCLLIYAVPEFHAATVLTYVTYILLAVLFCCIFAIQPEGVTSMAVVAIICYFLSRVTEFYMVVLMVVLVGIICTTRAVVMTSRR